MELSVWFWKVLFEVYEVSYPFDSRFPREHLLLGVVREIRRYPSRCTIFTVMNPMSGELIRFVRNELVGKKKISIFNVFTNSLKEDMHIQVHGFIRQKEGNDEIGWINQRTVVAPVGVDIGDIFDFNPKLGWNVAYSSEGLVKLKKLAQKQEDRNFYNSLIRFKLLAGAKILLPDERNEKEEIRNFIKKDYQQINVEFQNQKRKDLIKHEEDLKSHEKSLQNFIKEKQYEIYGWDKKQALEDEIINKKNFIEGFKRDYNL